MRKLFFILLLIIPLTAFSQDKFRDGFKEGFCAGYKYEKPNANCLSTPVTPLRRVDQKDTFRDGYNEGFSRGSAKAREEIRIEEERKAWRQRNN